jgi:hypothetical protein
VVERQVLTWLLLDTQSSEQLFGDRSDSVNFHPMATCCQQFRATAIRTGDMLLPGPTCQVHRIDLAC